MRTPRRHLSTIHRVHTEVAASGTGKTETFVRLLSSTSAASHQPDSGICQIPCLHIERQYRRKGAKDLAYAMFQALDELVPTAGYTEMFARKRCVPTDMLMNDVARVLYRHRVGVLVIDELTPNSTRCRPPEADWETLLRQISLLLPH